MQEIPMLEMTKPLLLEGTRYYDARSLDHKKLGQFKQGHFLQRYS